MNVDGGDEDVDFVDELDESGNPSDFLFDRNRVMHRLEAELEGVCRHRCWFPLCLTTSVSRTVPSSPLLVAADRYYSTCTTTASTRGAPALNGFSLDRPLQAFSTLPTSGEFFFSVAFF